MNINLCPKCGREPELEKYFEFSDVVAFSKGYKKADMFYIVDNVYLAGDSNHPEWGEPKTPHYVIKLGERVELVD